MRTKWIDAKKQLPPAGKKVFVRIEMNLGGHICEEHTMAQVDQNGAWDVADWKKDGVKYWSY